MSRRPLVFSAFALAAVTSLACTPGPTDTDSLPVPTAPSYAGRLDLEIRGAAEITLTATSKTEMKASLVVTGAAAPHLLDDDTNLQGFGRFEPLPEAGLELYVAKLTLPADAEGPCGTDPRAVALSLSRRGTSPRFAGALTIYCGTSHSGIPARAFRLSGTLNLTP